MGWPSPIQRLLTMAHMISNDFKKKQASRTILFNLPLLRGWNKCKDVNAQFGWVMYCPMRCFFFQIRYGLQIWFHGCVGVDEINESMIFKVPGNTLHEIYDLPLVSVDFIRRSTTLTNSWAGAMLKKDLVEQYLQAKPWCRVLQHHSDNVLLNRRHLGIHIVDTYVELYIAAARTSM